MRLPGGSHQLTYCTNIHPAQGWPRVLENLRAYAPRLKAEFAPAAPFGLGLRLAAAEAEQVLCAGGLAELRSFLDSEGLYVALLNGYPYGHFSGRPVKAEVFAPDWRTHERLRYTLNLAAILRQTLPAGTDGGVSTVPLSYKPWQPGSADGWRSMVRHVVGVCEYMARAREESGCLLHLDIEPEPDGLLETAAECIAFFEERLLPLGTPLLAGALGISRAEAAGRLLEHVRVCFDTCHFAVGYEDPARALAALARAGIRLGRIQVSSALAVALDDAARRGGALARLQELAEPIYLHQVVERRRDGSFRRYRDLPEALASAGDPDAREWRIHFHVPIFAAAFAGLGSTQDSIRQTLLAHPPATHLEIETYTWSVLPEPLRLGMLDSIRREYAWVLDQLCAKPSSSTLSG